MSLNGRWRKRNLILLLPFLFLAFWLVGLPLPLPHFCVPIRTYFAIGKQTAIDSNKNIFQGMAIRTSFLVFPERLMPMSPGYHVLDQVIHTLPESPVFDAVIADMAENPIRACGFKIVTSRTPSVEELESLRKAAGSRRIEIKLFGENLPSIIQAATRRLDSLAREVETEILFSPEAAQAASLTVTQAGFPTPLFSSSGDDLPPDRTLEFKLDRAQGAQLSVSATLASGKKLDQTLYFESAEEQKPRILVLSRPKGGTILDTLYSVTYADPDNLTGFECPEYELIVVDGVPLSSIQGKLARDLQNVIRNRTGSLLFVADSPDFGIAGSNPDIEELLPVTLIPRSLKNLPDMAVLLLIDISGSMFGDKLSLAKITGLELVRNLKSDDRVGMILFSDSRDWIYRFEKKSGLRPALPLEPVTARGGTELGPVLKEGIDALAQIKIPEKHIVIVSDGVTKPDDFAAHSAEAARLGITISTMGVGKDADRKLLSSIASRTNGRYYPVESADRIPSLIFEDRISMSRTPFAHGKILILDTGGSQTGSVSGMAQYTARPSSLVFFSNESGDPLFASREFGNRAVLYFGSDIRGQMTKDFFAVNRAVSVFRSRLDALFTDTPPEIRIAEFHGLTQAIIRGDRMVQPGIVYSRSGFPEINAPFFRSPSGLWSATLALPESGEWHARILDRGTVVSGFRIFVNHGFSGRRTVDEKALTEFRPGFWALLPRPALWLFFFFASCLASSIAQRRPR